MTWMQTYTGIKFDLLDISPESIDLEDIVVSLSRQLRFNGHTTKPYNIAQHSVLVADLVLQDGGRWDQVMAALLHDAHEAYTSDIPSPIKWAIGDEWAPMKALQNKIDDAIATTFEFDVELFSDPLIKLADGSALWHEKHALLQHVGHEWNWDLILGGEDPLLMPNAEDCLWMDLGNPWNEKTSKPAFRGAINQVATHLLSGVQS